MDPVVPAKVYDYGSHNSALLVLGRQAVVWSSSTVHLPRPSSSLLIGISETLIQSKCTGIILFVYYVLPAEDGTW